NAGTQNGPGVELDGTSAGPTANGLRIFAGGSYVRGVVINRFAGDGIYASTITDLTITGCYIGTDAAGDVDLGNAGSGIDLYHVANGVVGGATASERNV